MQTTNSPIGQENMMNIKTTRRNYLFVIQKRIGKEWERITDAVFTKRSVARECVRELRNTTANDYRVRKLGIVK